jgi:hypothetical protein
MHILQLQKLQKNKTDFLTGIQHPLAGMLAIF